MIELLSKVLEHLVTGEVMQMTAKPDRLAGRCRFNPVFASTE